MASNHLFRFVLSVVVPLSWLAVPVRAEDELLRPEKALAWTPPEIDGAELYPRIEFLKPRREWERMDIWIPTEPKEEKLPCVVVVYGGGYGEKNMPLGDFRPLLGHGFVVAAPDYALKTNAPVPLCSWDVAAAIRFLRAHAAEYRIDPERIGLWGWSAGGWIAQDLCYAGPQRLIRVRQKKLDNQQIEGVLPMLEPRPANADQSVRVQAVVSDWGAGKLWDRRTLEPAPWLTADDPPLLTCYNGPFTPKTINPVVLLQRLGVAARGVYGFTGNTHVPNLKTPCVDEDGRETTWGESIYEFLEQRLASVEQATAPEMLPHGGPIDGPTEVRLLTVHPTGAIHYTLDGTEPSAKSARYTAPVSVGPGDTLKAIVIRPGARPSATTTGVFAQGPPQPRITTDAREFSAKVGRPFSVTFEAEHADNATWFAGGMLGDSFRSFGGRRFNPPRHIAWMRIDPATGVLSGTPRVPGVYPLIVSCTNTAESESTRDVIQTSDAVMAVVRVED